MGESRTAHRDHTQNLRPRAYAAVPTTKHRANQINANWANKAHHLGNSDMVATWNKAHRVKMFHPPASWIYGESREKPVAVAVNRRVPRTGSIDSTVAKASGR